MAVTKYSITVSGKSFEAGIKTRFPVKPTTRKDFGHLADGAYQMKFSLTKKELRTLADLMAELALDASDSGDEAAMNAIYKDMGKFPAESGIR